MASDKVQTITDGNFDVRHQRRQSPCSWISGLSGAARANVWRRQSRSWRATTTGRWTSGSSTSTKIPNTAFKFSIRGIPTLLLFKGGQVVEQVVGLADKDSLKKVIDKHVA